LTRDQGAPPSNPVYRTALQRRKTTIRNDGTSTTLSLGSRDHPQEEAGEILPEAKAGGNAPDMLTGRRMPEGGRNEEQSLCPKRRTCLV